MVTGLDSDISLRGDVTPCFVQTTDIPRSPRPTGNQSVEKFSDNSSRPKARRPRTGLPGTIEPAPLAGASFTAFSRSFEINSEESGRIATHEHGGGQRTSLPLSRRSAPFMPPARATPSPGTGGRRSLLEIPSSPSGTCSLCKGGVHTSQSGPAHELLETQTYFLTVSESPMTVSDRLGRVMATALPH